MTNDLIESGKIRGVRSIASGEQHPVLQELAEAHALWMAVKQIQGHQGFDDRCKEIRERAPDLDDIHEIVAESWPENKDSKVAALDLFDSWKQSPGHWSVANGDCRYWGYEMAQDYNGKWYGCGITAK